MPNKHANSRSITSLYIFGALVTLAFAVVAVVIAVYLEYRSFNEEIGELRVRYIQEQKERIKFDTNRVLKFIEDERSNRRHAVDEWVLKRQIISAISKLYGRQDGRGYIFIYDFNGICLSDPVQTQNVGKNLYEFRDSGGVQVIKELIDISKRDKGGFVEYHWIKPTTKERSPKVSYARVFKPWRWMVGTGVYLDEVEKVIASKREALQQKMLYNLFRTAMLMLVLFLVGLVGIQFIIRIVQRETDKFSRFFSQAAQEHIRIDPSQIGLKEFGLMAGYVNSMVDEIHKRKKRLKKINASLEEKVDNKTRSLQERNAMLAKEKQVNEELVKAQDRFIRSAIHEINTPLAVIMTHIDIYKMKYEQNRYIEKIEAATKMIATIYDDLGYVVKKNRLEHEKSWIDFGVFLHERARFFQEIALGNSHELVVEAEDELMVFFSETELQRIVDNNFSNAIKYARRSTPITIRLAQENEKICLKFVSYSKKIIDTERIFEPFHREDNLVEGFGLGLEIVRSICDENSVEIDVSSDAEYTIFKYYFERNHVDENTTVGR